MVSSKNFRGKVTALVCISFASIFAKCSSCPGDDFRNIMFKEPIPNKAMTRHVIRSEQVPNEGSCRVLCYMEPNCVSINVGRLKTEGALKCELNNATDENQFADFLQSNVMFTYLAIENPCSSSPCGNNGTCQAGFTSKGFRCICHAGFTGTNCHEDIDECITGRHDCHVNANCTNAVGSHNCTCKEGYTGDGRSCADCSSSSHRFEKYQDLPTIGAAAVEQFNIDGSLFLAFPSYRSDIHKWQTESFIYKLNESTAKFSLYQAIETSRGNDFEHFSIAGKHYLAFANHRNGATYQVDSVIYQWTGTQFVVYQNIRTNGATSFHFFNILKEMFLAVTNYFDGTTHNINSTIYKWKNHQFEKFQEIPTEGAYGSTAFVINNESFIAFANLGSLKQNNFVESTILKWSGGEFVKMQSLQTYRARRVKSFNMNGHTFLAFAIFVSGGEHNVTSFIYKWDGSQFVLFQSIPTRGAVAWDPFVMYGQTFLGVANFRKNGGGSLTQSVVYRASGERFVSYQEISTKGAIDMTSFVHKGDTYLAIANLVYNSKYNINSVLYKWTFKNKGS